MLNWTKTVPVAAIVLTIVLGFNSLLKFGLEKTGDAAFGAKTEIGGFSLNFLVGDLKIDKLQVANKNAPMTNLFEVSKIRFGLNTEQLFYKRVNIPAVTVDNILLGTPRRKSGALPVKIKPPDPPKPPMDFAKMARDLGMNPAALQDAFKTTPPQSPAAAERIQKENQKLLSDAQKQTSSLDVNKELAALNLDELFNVNIQNLDDLKKFQALAESKQKGLTALSAAVEANRAAGDKALRDVQKNLDDLARLRNADIDRLMDSFNFANYDFAALGRELLGPKINGWINMGMEYWALAQKYMPPKKEKVPPKPKKERLQGATIVFPNNKTRPRFWLGRLGLSGTGGQGTSNELNYHGYISDIASEQYLVGRPAVLDIEGQYAKRPSSRLKIKGVFDRLDTPKDSFTFVLSGFDMTGQQFWDTKTIPLEITEGLGVIDADIKITDGDLSGKVSFVGRNLRYAKTRNQAGLENLIAEAVMSAPELRVDILLSGSIGAPNIRLTTNLDSLIKARLDKEIGGQLEQAKAQLLAEYDKVVGGAQDTAEQAVREQKEALQSGLAAQQNALAAEQARLETLLKEKEKQFQGQADIVKKQAEDALKKALPGLKF